MKVLILHIFLMWDKAGGEPNTIFPTPTGGYTAPSLDGRGDFWTTEVTRTPVSTKEAFGVNLTGTYEFENGWILTSITGFESVDSFEDRDTDGTPFLGQIFTIADDVEQWSQEFTLNGPGRTPSTGSVALTIFPVISS